MPSSLSAKKNTREGDGHLADASTEYKAHSSFWESKHRVEIKEKYSTAQKDGQVLHEKLDGRGVLPQINPMNIALSYKYNSEARDVHHKTQTASDTAHVTPAELHSQSMEWKGLNSIGRQAYLDKERRVVLDNTPNTTSRDGTYGGERESFPTGSLSSPNQGGDHYTFLPPVNHKERLAADNVQSNPNQGGNNYTHHPQVHHKERLATSNLSVTNQGGNSYTHQPPVNHKERLAAGNVQGGNNYTHHPQIHHKERLATSNLGGTNQGGNSYTHQPPVHHKERLATGNVNQGGNNYTSSLSSPNQGGDHYTHHPPGHHKGKGKSYPSPTPDASRDRLPQTDSVNAFNGYMPSIQEASSPAHYSSSPYNNAYPVSASRPVGSNNAYPGQAGPNRAPYVTSGANPSTNQYTEGRQSDESYDPPSYRTTPGSNEGTCDDPNLNRAPSYASHAPAATYGQASTSNAGASGSAHDRSRVRQSSSKHRS